MFFVTFDRYLNFDKHISNICSSLYFHIRSIRHICPFLDSDRPGHDVKLHPDFHCHWQLFLLMCHEAGQSAFRHTLLYLSTNLDHILFSNISRH